MSLRSHALGLALAASLSGCATMQLRSAVSMTVAVAEGTPADASVFIDEQYVGPLGYVAGHGVRLPSGEHRVTVEKTGYFPWDALVVSNRAPVSLEVALTRIPD